MFCFISQPGSAMDHVSLTTEERAETCVPCCSQHPAPRHLMGKHKKRKRPDAPQAQPSQFSVAATAAASSPSTTTKLTAQDVATTIATLTHLAENPELLASKALRELRAALHPIVEAQLKKYDPVDYVARVTTALRVGQGADALLGLQGLHARGQTARQGTVQRWVRDCDSIADITLRTRLLHAVLRAGKPLEERGGEAEEDDDEDDAVAVAQSADSDAGDGDGDDGDGDEADNDSAPKPPPDTSSVVHHAPFIVPPSTTPTPTAPPPHPAAIDRTSLDLRIVLTEAGPERQPPNHHDLHIYTLQYPLLDSHGAPPAPTRLSVPHVPGAFVLSGLLSPSECATLTAVANAIGYTPDHPLARPAASGIGGLEILMNKTMMRSIFARCESLLPTELGGGRVAGINERCRLFKYTAAEGAVYRPHIDGSWPGSGLDEISGAYRHDAYGDRRSRLTFLIYLNDDFDGGCTTFYLPSTAAVGGAEQLCARGVVPRAGSVLCFPQGNTASLLHEGSAVTRGVKYVIRSDVLYTVHRPEGRR